MSEKLEVSQIPSPKISSWLFLNPKSSSLWLLIRVYVGYQWLQAGWEKIINPTWVGGKAGSALTGFIDNALTKTIGNHPAVQNWYALFLKTVVLSHPTLFSYLVAYGELAVGVGLILGAFTAIAAFFGALMNMNFLLAGAVSLNPILFLFELFLILAWRVAGWIGLDYYLLPNLGVPWQSGRYCFLTGLKGKRNPATE